VLDTAIGRPASDVPVSLAICRRSSSTTGLVDAVWSTVATGVTNTNGRVDSLLPNGKEIEPGVYRMTFHVAPYMKRCKAAHPGFFADRPFYPLVTVYFEVGSEQVGEHFHVPLTWNPYGYSTYRGS
jgi:hydroxyisourate hydrolase